MTLDDDWQQLTDLVAAHPDSDARIRLEEAIAALRATDLEIAPLPDFSDAELDEALSAAARITLDGEVGAIEGRLLAALPHDHAGRLIEELLRQERSETLAVVSVAVPPHRFPVTRLLLAAREASDGVRRDLLRAAALAPTATLIRGVIAALDQSSAADSAIGSLVGEVAAIRRSIAAAGERYQWWEEPRAVAPQSQDGGATRSADDRVVWRGSEEAHRTAYPRLRVETGTERPDVVVVDQPFEVSVGLQPRRDGALVSSSPIPFASGAVVELEAVLLYDPASIEVTGSPRGTITVSDADPFPTLAFTCVARWVDRVHHRRLGLQLLRAGQVVAVAWRSVTAVDEPADVSRAEAPPDRAVELLELDPLLGEEPPDLVVSVCRADVASPTFVWTAYAADPAVAVPDLPSTMTLEEGVSDFALETRRSIQFSTDPAKDYLGLAGRAVRIGRAVPESIQAAVRQVVEAPGRTEAPAILLLTEELHVPWELATFTKPLHDSWGGGSPFLGAHAAVSRWPLSEHRPRPRPVSRVPARSVAVLTAEYQGVPGWGRLDSAVAEAAEVATLFGPDAETIEPDLWAVMNLFRGVPEADVLHVALHGQYDAQGDQEGLVLLSKSPAGGAVAQFISPVDLETCQLEQGPFVFLNACQVGTDEQVLGDYGGFASTLLRIGAAGVVAPLWNVLDDFAAGVSRSFYAATLTASQPVSAAEAMRAVRATYTEERVRAGDPAVHSTLIAYQVFGHPRLTLTR